MYPPSPWHLRGQLHLSLFLVPRARLPELPAGVRPLGVAGRIPVGAAWVTYEPGGDLTYRELLTAVLVRDGRRPRATITHIWVDSVASRDGGRELWAIPKHLARLRIAPPAAAATGIATATLRPGWRLPGRWPTPMSLAQDRGAGLQVTPVRGTAALALLRTDWSVAPAGPLAWLTGRRPLLSLTLADFRLRFGRLPAHGDAVQR
ncbi:acetoacetate decarboxylase family protein [Symbioplanes lichenis]|uniref:acetoacetate decarboxylase family protein n=1 Tax=Symbioplanes lichenis TaxID=1629072 RepID=UPI002738C368|nr:acetoacetate decarboxylase family protein [Actinoplanes lichenis]